MFFCFSSLLFGVQTHIRSRRRFEERVYSALGRRAMNRTPVVSCFACISKHFQRDGLRLSRRRICGSRNTTHIKDVEAITTIVKITCPQKWSRLCPVSAVTKLWRQFNHKIGFKAELGDIMVTHQIRCGELPSRVRHAQDAPDVTKQRVWRVAGAVLVADDVSTVIKKSKVTRSAHACRVS